MHKNIVFKSYLNNEIDEYELVKSMDKLQSKNIKNDGVIYTPLHIVQYMIKLAKIDINDKIIEPSCGHGVFLFALLNHVYSTYNMNVKDLFNWFSTKVYAVDISENTIIELKEMLSLYFKKMGLEETSFDNIICQDSLSIELNSFDLAIGNPPYVRTKNLEKSYLKNLRNTFKSCEKGNVDLYYAFIEKYHTISNKVCFITPNSFFTNVSGKRLIGIISNDFEEIIDFKEKLIFEDARTYTTIFKLNKLNNNDTYIYRNDLNSKFTLEEKLKFNPISENNKNNITVLSGIATLSDFTYTVKESDGKFFATYLGIVYEIEKNILVPLLKLTKIKGQLIEKFDYIIYPYAKDSKIILEESFIAENYPKCYEYLKTVREKLDLRDKGKVEKYEKWYAYGRKQGLHKNILNKVIIIPQMIGKNCIPQLLDITKLYNDYGQILFTSGFIIPYEGSLLHDSILGTDFLDYAKKTGKPWPGKTEPYYSLTSNQVRNFK
jgi:adenine-specific DNA-methyltransferase